MASILKRLTIVLVSTAALGGATAVMAPVASAATAPAAVAAAGPRCKPAHFGRDWRWDDTRRGGHWDHKVEIRRGRHKEIRWEHRRGDNKFCASRRGNGGWDHR